MSSDGRAQDALWWLYEQEEGYMGEVLVPGPVQAAGVSREAWSALVPQILDAVRGIYIDFGRTVERRHGEAYE